MRSRFRGRFDAFMRPPPLRSGTARSLRAVTAIALTAAPLLPLIGAVWVMLAAGLPDYALDGDGAFIELRVRNAVAGRQLLGSYSRLGFDHPGPLHFYAAVPWYVASAGSAMSLNLTTALLQAVSLATALVLILRAGGLAALAAASLVCTAWVGQLGQILIAAWDPTMMIMPTLACCSAAAAFAAGRVWALPIAAFAAVFAAQSHLSLVPPAATALATGVILHAALARRVAASGRRGPAIACAVAVAVLAALPPLVEQLRGEPGNLTKILATLGGAGAHPGWGDALAVAVAALASFGSGVVGIGPRTTAGTLLVVVQVVLVVVAVVRAVVERRPAIVAIGAVALALHLAAVVAVQRIVGGISPHMLLWIATGSVLAWSAVVGEALGTVRRLGARARGILIAAVAIAIAVPGVRGTARMLEQMRVFVAAPAAAARTQLLDQAADRVVQALQRCGARGVRIRALPSPARAAHDPFTAPSGLALALHKRGIAFEPEPGEAHAYPDGLPAPTPPIATLLLFEPDTRERVETLMDVVDVIDAGTWGVAVRAP